jgi:hypothetical protein
MAEEYNQLKPHSALGYRPPAPEVILTQEISNLFSGFPCDRLKRARREIWRRPMNMGLLILLEHLESQKVLKGGRDLEKNCSVYRDA